MKTTAHIPLMLLSLLCLAYKPVAAQLSADTDGDGEIDLITVVTNGIQIVHGGTGITKLYPYSNVNFSLSSINDTDGVLGDEIIVLWAGGSGSNGIHVIHDKTGTTNNYQQDRNFTIKEEVSDTDGEPGNEIIVTWVGSLDSKGIQVIHDRTGTTHNYQQDRDFTIKEEVSDTDGEPGNEIIVIWTGSLGSNGIQVICDRTGTTHNYQQDRQFSIFGVSDTDGQLGNEIILIWAGTPPYNGIQVIRDRTESTNNYQQDRQFSIFGVSDTDGQLGNEIILIWTGTPPYNGIQVIHDRTKSIYNYQQDRLFSVNSVTDTDGQAGSEIIVSWAGDLGSNGIAVFHDRTKVASNYAIDATFTIGDVRDFDCISGAEICYSWISGSTRYALIVDRTRTIIATSGCSTCSFAISPASKSFGADGGTGSINVTTESGCCWTAVSSANWITITSGSSGSGNGTARYSVAANTGTSLRTGTLTVAGKSFTISQAGAPGCNYTITPTSQSFIASGGTGTVNVATTSACSWTAVSHASWITITSGNSGSGNGTVRYSVAANTSTSPRTGTLTIAGKFFTVNQGAPGQECVTDSAQLPNHKFRSRRSGNWSSLSTWEEYHPETQQWCPAERIPGSTFGSIEIRYYGSYPERTDVVTITSPVLVDQISVRGRLEVRGPNGHLTVTNGDNNDPYDLEVKGYLVVERGLTSERLTLLPGAKAHIYRGGEFTILKGSSAYSAINNLGDMFIEGHVVWEGGSVIGNPFRYGLYDGYLRINDPAGSVIDDGSVLWPATDGPIYVMVMGPLTMNALRTLPSLYTSAPVTNAHKLTFSGALEIACGGAFDSSPSYGDSATLYYRGRKCSHNLGPEWISGTIVGRGVPKNVRIGMFDSTIVNMPSSPRRCPGNLEIAGTLVLSSSAGADLSVGGDFHLLQSSFAGKGEFIPNSGEVVFDGTTEQFLIGATTFDDLTINNSSGISFKSGSGWGADIMKVNQTLRFMAGNLRLNRFQTFIILAGDVIGASIASHVVAPYETSVMRSIAANDSFQFPIGPSDIAYNPVTIALAPDDPTETFSVSVGSELYAADHPSQMLRREWYIHEKTGGGNNARLTFQWAASDSAGPEFHPGAGIEIFRHDYNTWQWIGTAATYNAGPPCTATAAGFTVFDHVEYFGGYGGFGVGNAGALTSVAAQKEAPQTFALYQNSPNPFNPSTTIRYAIPHASYVTLKVYDLVGNEIETLVSEKQSAREYTIRWNPVGLPSGVYFYRLEAEGFAQTKKLLLMK